MHPVSIALLTNFARVRQADLLSRPLLTCWIVDSIVLSYHQAQSLPPRTRNCCIRNEISIFLSPRVSLVRLAFRLPISEASVAHKKIDRGGE